MLVSRRGLAPGRMALCLAATSGAAVLALLPIGSSRVLAAGSNHGSASTLLGDACGDTLAASAFRAHGHVTSGGTSMTIDVYFGSAGGLLTITQHGDQTARAILNGRSTYFEGNRPFWQSITNSRRAASFLTSRWIDMTSDTKDTAGITKNFNKTQLLSQCGQGRTATYAGSATVNGVKTVKVHQVSGRESDTYYIEKSQTPYVVRVSGSTHQKDTGDFVFSDYGVQPNTAAPPGAVPISQFQ